MSAVLRCQHREEPVAGLNLAAMDFPCEQCGWNEAAQRIDAGNLVVRSEPAEELYQAP